VDLIDWAREPTHPIAKNIFGPSPTLTLTVIAALGIWLSTFDLPSWSALNISVLWTGLVIRWRWTNREVPSDLTDTERDHLGRSIATPLLLAISVYVLGEFALGLPEDATTAELLIDLMRALSLALIAIPVLVLAKGMKDAIVQMVLIVWLVTFSLILSRSIVEATRQWREALLNALLEQVGLSVPNWFDPLTEFLFWLVVYTAISGIAWLAARQTIDEQLTGDNEVDVAERLKDMLRGSESGLYKG
jgi:hypothetical protein